jgi:hypothetical protein
MERLKQLDLIRSRRKGMKPFAKVLLLFIILWMFVLLADVILFLGRLLSSEDPIPALDSPLVVALLLFGALGALLFGLAGLWGIVSRQAGNDRTLIIGTIVFLLAGLLIGSSLFIRPRQVTLTPGGFEPLQITIGQGGGFLLTNTTSIRQILCLGSHHRCDRTQQTPQAFALPGLTILPGQTVSVAFPDAGTYRITFLSPQVSQPDLTVVVNEPSDSGPDMPCETSC